jgi:hypothetical protein
VEAVKHGQQGVDEAPGVPPEQPPAEEIKQQTPETPELPRAEEQQLRAEMYQIRCELTAAYTIMVKQDEDLRNLRLANEKQQMQLERQQMQLEDKDVNPDRWQQPAAAAAARSPQQSLRPPPPPPPRRQLPEVEVPKRMGQGARQRARAAAGLPAHFIEVGQILAGLMGQQPALPTPTSAAAAIAAAVASIAAQLPRTKSTTPPVAP